MERDLACLADRVHDLAVVGGGIYGACIARDAALRGLSVALVERGDFGGATSGNSLGIVHGGLRYLQDADLPRMRESIRERTIWLRIAPHLVRPLPVLIPTCERFPVRRTLLAVALAFNDLLSLDRNRGLPQPQRIPPGRVVSRQECLDLVPGLKAAGLTGGVLFHDARMIDPDRLTLAVVRSAIEAGAVAANYAEVTGFLGSEGRVSGVQLLDRLGGSRLDLRARVVVNAAGPWVGALLARLPGRGPVTRPPLARAMNVVVRQRLTRGCAVGVASQRREPRRLAAGRRLFFIVPWRDRSAVGTIYFPHSGDPDAFRPTVAEVRRFVREINDAHPAARLDLEDIRLVLAGLLPCDGEPAGGEVRLATRYRIHDHAREDGVEGLVSVVGVKYTTARSVAERIVNLAFTKLGYRLPPPALTATRSLPGAADPDALAAEAAAASGGRLPAEALRRLAGARGTAYREVLALLDESPALAVPLAAGSPVLAAEVVYAVRREMARTLADVVFRRVGLAATGHPGEEAMAACASLAAAELGWDRARIETELAAVRRAIDGWREDDGL